MPEIVEPLGGLRTVEQTTEMRWGFDYGPHGMFANSATAAQRAQSNAIYTKYNMSRVSTARPAITGTHTTGLYFDVATAYFLAWLLVNGHRYGIKRPLENDPNHMQVTPGTETVALNVTGLDNTTSTPAKQPKEDAMDYSYIQRPTGPGNKTQWALLGVQLPNGAVVTQDVAVANGFAAFDVTGGRITDDAHWQPTLDQAKINSDLWKAAVASSGSSSAPPTDLSELVQAVTAGNALLSELLAATKVLNPPG
jgi:hypothetical protein